MLGFLSHFPIDHKLDVLTIALPVGGVINMLILLLVSACVK